MKSVNPADIVQGIRFRFVDVFGNSQGMAVADSKDDAAQYYVVDTYCMNPDCRCDEVYLQFIKNNEQIKNERAGFTILFSVGTKGYELKGIHGISEKEADEVVKKEVKKSKEMIELLKQRYKKMKQAGREVLQIDKGTVDKLPGKAKRNEPCPCGSGKKYKQCCGA